MSDNTKRESDQHGVDDRATDRRRIEIDRRTKDGLDRQAEPESIGATRGESKAAESAPKLSTAEYFDRLDRISERSSLRHLSDFDPVREQQVEDIELRTSPVGFLKRQEHAGLDGGTIKLVGQSLEDHGIRGADDLRAHGVEDTWGIWESKAE